MISMVRISSESLFRRRSRSCCDRSKPSVLSHSIPRIPRVNLSSRFYRSFSPSRPSRQADKIPWQFGIFTAGGWRKNTGIQRRLSINYYRSSSISQPSSRFLLPVRGASRQQGDRLVENVPFLLFSSFLLLYESEHAGGRRSKGMMRMPQGILSIGLASVSDWWNEINESSQWQDGIFFFLCAAYALVSSVALIQLIRIQLRVPEYGWTTQKVFHLMNFVVNGVRAIVFGFHKQVFFLKPKVFALVLLDLPGLLFFSTYTLLVLFWAEIYHQARSLPTDKLRLVYMSVNGGIYFIQVCIWIYQGINDISVVDSIGHVFIAVVSFVAALGFLLYGGRLFFMLRRFPIESKGRRKKLHEVGSVTAICFTCFLIRCIMVAISAFDVADASLEVMDHPVLNLIYYLLAEILPSALVLYILRKLPPKRVSAQYHPIR